MVAKSSKRTHTINLPCIGLWNRTDSTAPSPGNTLVGLWIEDNGYQSIQFFCAYFCNAAGEGVDPGEEDWTHITYHSRQAGWSERGNEEIEPPDYWAEARWMIPEWGGA
jgi:hypothetical protein